MTASKIAFSKILLAGFVLTAGAASSSGCSYPAKPEATPPPRAEAHPLPVVEGKQPHPKMPKLPGDTRP